MDTPSAPRSTPDPEPHWVCLKCGQRGYCRYKSGMPRRPDLSKRAMQKWHHLDCDGDLEYRAGVALPIKEEDIPY